MKRTKLFAYMFNLYSMSAVAGYHCDLKLAHTEDLHQVIAEKSISISTGQMNSGNLGTLYVESQTRRKKVSLDINAVLSGWVGEEDASIVIIRRTTKKRGVVANQTISDIMTVKGENKLTGWFDSYKLGIDCKITE